MKSDTQASVFDTINTMIKGKGLKETSATILDEPDTRYLVYMILGNYTCFYIVQGCIMELHSH